MKTVLKMLVCLSLVIIPMQVEANGRLREHILAENPVRTGADFSIVANLGNAASQEGLFTAPDNYGTSHFFRGTHQGLNNNVIFAGHQWKILRIDGAGNIRLIYNGTCADNSCTINGNTAGAATSIQNSVFNIAANHNRFVGYMFGEAIGSFSEQHANINNSAVKNAVDGWFDTLTAEAKELIVTTTYCADRLVTSGTGLGTTSTDYAGVGRVETGRAPTLECAQANDRISLNAGLITIDEAAMAGNVWREANNDNFLRTSQVYWTMTPRRLTDGIVSNFHVATNGGLDRSDVAAASRGVRPVITINKDVGFEGTGTLTDPYIITELYEEVEPIPEPSNPEDNDQEETDENEDILVNPQTSDFNVMLMIVTTTIALAGIWYSTSRINAILSRNK